MIKHALGGVYAAAVTPLTANDEPDLPGLQILLDFFADRGCHGALLLGTTGEGPSFSSQERIAIWETAARWRTSRPTFRLLAGTGTPSLSESLALNRAAFQLGFEAVVVLPPFFFRNAPEGGLFDWYARLIEGSVPEDRLMLGYHIPAVSGVSLPVSLMQKLDSTYPMQFGGLKDSSGSLESAAAYAAALPGKAVMVGNDKLLGPGLAAGAAGCITAGANLHSLHSRAIYDAFHRNEDTTQHQAVLDKLRAAMDAMPPAPSYLKALLHTEQKLPLWPVRAPLQGFNAQQTGAAIEGLHTAANSES